MMPWFRLMRPFTLLPPAIGMISGACAAIGAGRVSDVSSWMLFLSMTAGALLAAFLNAASNIVNQVFDLQLDLVNKPDRPLARGEIGRGAALGFAFVLYGLALVLAALLQPDGSLAVFWIVAFTALLTWMYSGPPFRWRNSWWLAPLVIALPRGLLLKVAGWGAISPVDSDHEPWVLGSIFFVFILGAAAIKDFEDMEGDAAGGASSLPLRFGAKRAAWLMAPFLVLPWLLLALAPWFTWNGSPLLRIAPSAAALVGGILMAFGFVAARALLRMASGMTNKVAARAAWRAMYLQMMAAQVLTAAAYWWPADARP
ncbi:MAG: hypothetical protein EXS14_01310 [Planctomycetes bacterium]|nr:hypothetical protein [Planctomycetota bacterium]